MIKKIDVFFLFSIILILFNIRILKITLNNGYIVSVYMSTFLILIYYISLLLNLKLKKTDNLTKILIITTVIYSMYSIIAYLINSPDYILIEIFNILAINTSILIALKYSSIFKIHSYINVLTNVMSIIMIIATILGFLKINYLSFSLVNGIELIKDNEFYSTGLNFIFNHKSRFATFCIMAITLILNKRYKNKLIKIALVMITIANIYFSSSYTAMLVSLLIILYYLKYILKIRINKKTYYSLIVFIYVNVVLIITKGLQLVSENRNIFSLGDRVNIWKVMFLNIKDNFGGVGFTRGDYYFIREGLYVDTAHNMYIQEFIQNGYIGGILNLIIVVIIGVIIYKGNKIFFVGYIGVQLMFCMDIIQYEVFYNIYYYNLGFIIAFCINEKNSKINERNCRIYENS